MASERQGRARRLIVALVALAVLVALDRFTKILATEHLSGTGVHSYLGDLLRVEYALNPGVFLGWGGEMPAAFRIALFQWLTVVAAVISLGVAFFRKGLSDFSLACAILIGAGAIGNGIDRFSHHGVVTDFLNVGIGSLRTGIFNVADMALTGGCLLLALRLVSPERPQAPEMENEAGDR